MPASSSQLLPREMELPGGWPAVCRLQEGGEGVARELALGDEAAGAGGADPIGDVRGVARGRDDHDRRAGPARELLRHREAVGVGQVDVEQDDVGGELAHRTDAVRAVPRLADDGVALRLEQPARTAPEAAVVVDDEDGERHAGDRCAGAPASPCGQPPPGVRFSATVWTAAGPWRPPRASSSRPAPGSAVARSSRRRRRAGRARGNGCRSVGALAAGSAAHGSAYLLTARTGAAAGIGAARGAPGRGWGRPQPWPRSTSPTGESAVAFAGADAVLVYAAASAALPIVQGTRWAAAAAQPGAPARPRDAAGDGGHRPGCVLAESAGAGQTATQRRSHNGTGERRARPPPRSEIDRDRDMAGRRRSRAIRPNVRPRPASLDSPMSRGSRLRPRALAAGVTHQGPDEPQAEDER